MLYVTLHHVDDLKRSASRNAELVNIYGTFVSESSKEGGTLWELLDETAQVCVKLGGKKEDYASYQPKPGDTVRIHRLKVQSGLAEVVRDRNVVVWPAFEQNPSMVTTARRPTITDDDKKRRITLEEYYTTRIHSLAAIKADRSSSGAFYRVHGCVEKSTLDMYNHINLDITDGTESLTLRVFCKSGPNDVDTHYELASKLKEGQYLFASNVKCDEKKRLNVSANLSWGRSLRLIDPKSVLGTKLGAALNRGTTNGADSQPRRSERLQNNQDENRQPEEAPTAKKVARPNTPTRTVDPLPKFTPICELQKNSVHYEYTDIVGMVSTDPTINSKGHCMLQIFDGSYHELPSFYAQDVESVKPGSVVILIYASVQPKDTDEHFRKAMSLKKGDLVHIRNLKISFPDGKIKPELNSNKAYNKGIDKVDKRSRLGLKILDMVENPAPSQIDMDTQPVASQMEMDTSASQASINTSDSASSSQATDTESPLNSSNASTARPDLSTSEPSPSELAKMLAGNVSTHPFQDA